LRSSDPDTLCLMDNRRRTAVVVQGCRSRTFEGSFSASLETWVEASHEDVDVFFVADDVELYREDIYDRDVLCGQPTSVSVADRFDAAPAKHLLWPRSTSNGFGERRIRPFPAAVHIAKRTQSKEVVSWN
jgi:hypothetical protein